MKLLTHADVLNFVPGAVLAQAARPAKGSFPDVRLPAHWPAQADLLAWCQQTGSAVAALLILFGLIYLLFGFKLVKWVVLLNAAAAGFLLGAILGGRSGAALPLAAVGAVLCGAVAVPTLKYSVAVMGGALGALIGATVWRMLELEPGYTWSGAMTGMVALGLFCFILFRGSVVTYTTFQGATMLVLGTLGLLLKSRELAPEVSAYLAQRPFVLPACVLIPTIMGIVYQQTGGAGVPNPAGGPPPGLRRGND